MSENIHTMVIRGMTIDSNYLVDVDENGMIYGMTQHHRLHHQPSYSNNFIWGHYSTLVWYPNPPISYVQAPPPSANVSSLEENTRMSLRRRRHHHRFLHRQYRAQEIRRHSNFHSYVTASPYRVPETTNHSRSSSMPIQNAPNRDNMHNLHPPAFREFPSYMIMDTDDMSYETLYNVQEFPSLGDPHSDMRLDIDGMSYEASQQPIGVDCILEEDWTIEREQSKEGRSTLRPIQPKQMAPTVGPSGIPMKPRRTRRVLGLDIATSDQYPVLQQEKKKL
ncbi:hypothetical protein VIGAN_06048200 [Vigna angularis var. angularis]|uniref:Uncharacterized protein n=1 Tax=Vigna angularis var. angularis TaxID=157739 RepID=A0A0S3S9M5_PHAAN|nr:hypothetical protein VIGAN_06048200 [Vigna angularis var. angularis]